MEEVALIPCGSVANVARTGNGLSAYLLHRRAAPHYLLLLSRDGTNRLFRRARQHRCIFIDVRGSLYEQIICARNNYIDVRCEADKVGVSRV